MIMDSVVLHTLADAVFPLAVAVVLPIVYTWLTYRNKQHETDKRSQIVMAFIEKNPDVDIQEFLNKLNPPRKSFREQLITKMHYEMLWGTICMIGGIATLLVIIVLSLLLGFGETYIPIGSVFGVLPLAVGCGLLAACNNAKKTLGNLREND